MLRSFGTAVIAVLALASAASADVDLPVGNGDLVTGTFDPPSEVETFRFRAPTLATLTVAVKGKKARGGTAVPAARFRVLNESDVEVGASVIVTTPTGAKMSNVELSGTGEYRVLVSCSNSVAGDYQLQIAWKTRTSLVYDSTVDAGFTVLGFGADAGSVPTVSVSVPKGSAAGPRLVRIEGGAFLQAAGVPAPGTTKFKFKGAALPVTENYSCFLTDQGGAGGGAFHAVVKLKLPKALRRKISLTSSVLGSLGNGSTFARGGLVGQGGGIVGIDDTSGTPIDGASVSVPGDALSSPTVIVIGTGSPIPGSGGNVASGPTVVFGPDGLSFAQDATITIPFDPAMIEAGGSGSLQVYTRNKKGKVSLVTAPLTVDLVAGTVSFPSSHFSAYRAFASARAPGSDLDADGIDDLVVGSPTDSVGRGAVLVLRGRTDFAGGKASDADFVLTGVNASAGQVDGDVFGASVATGDVNGDGVADLVVGATRTNAGRGSVYVFFGGPGFASKSSAAADATLSGAATDLRFGAALAVADATGDGIADVLVGSPLASSQGIETGAAHLFPGGTGFANRAVRDPGVLSVYGVSDFAHLGGALAIGELNGDSQPDIAVGEEQTGAQGAGAVHVFPDPDSIPSPAFAGQTGFSILGDGTLDRFGAAIAIGDLDQDGQEDLIVGAPGVDLYNMVPLLDVGSVFVFDGGPGFDNARASQASRTIVLPFGRPDDLGGSSIVVANVIGNSTPDLLIASPGQDRGPFVDGGAVFLSRGGTDFGSNFEVDFGDSDRERRGMLLAPADVNGDGHKDVVIASPNVNSDAGRVRVHLGPGILSGFVDVTGSPGQRLGDRDLGGVAFKR